MINYLSWMIDKSPVSTKKGLLERRQMLLLIKKSLQHSRGHLMLPISTFSPPDSKIVIHIARGQEWGKDDFTVKRWFEISNSLIPATVMRGMVNICLHMERAYSCGYIYDVFISYSLWTLECTHFTSLIDKLIHVLKTNNSNLYNSCP